MTSSKPTSPLPFDPASPLFVAKGVCSTVILGGITGASIGVYRSQNPFVFSVNMATNSGLAGLAFFGIREYLVSPILLSTGATSSHRRRYADLTERQREKLPQLRDGDEENEEAGSLSDIRSNRLLDSGLAGALAGGSLSWGVRGRGTALRAGFTAGLITTLLQFTVNQTRIIRLDLLSRTTPSSSSTSDPSSPTTPTFSSPSVPQTNPTSNSFTNPLKSTPSNAETDTSPSLPTKIMNVMSSFTPVRKISDEEYLEVLKKKRLDIQKRMLEIEDEERKLFDHSERL